MSPAQDDWDEHLDMAEFAVNNLYQSSIRTTPFEMVYGKLPYTPISMDQRMRGTKPASTTLAERLQENLQNARKNPEAAKQRMREYADRHRHDVQFAMGAWSC